jgi:hypothetical protein
VITPRQHEEALRLGYSGGMTNRQALLDWFQTKAQYLDSD